MAHHPVGKTVPLRRVEPFVQIAFQPAGALPPRLDERIVLDGDGSPDVAVRMHLKAPPAAEFEALSPAMKPVRRVTRESFSRVVARVGNAIVVRVPMK